MQRAQRGSFHISEVEAMHHRCDPDPNGKGAGGLSPYGAERMIVCVFVSEGDGWDDEAQGSDNQAFERDTQSQSHVNTHILSTHTHTQTFTKSFSPRCKSSLTLHD